MTSAGAVTPQQHARRIARLWILQTRVRRAYEAALLAARADRVPYALIAHDVLMATSEPRTERAHARVEWALRSATRRARVTARHAKQLARHPNKAHGGRMALQLRKRVRVIDYWVDDSVGLHGLDLGNDELERLNDDLDQIDNRDVERDHEHDACDRSCAAHGKDR